MKIVVLGLFLAAMVAQEEVRPLLREAVTRERAGSHAAALEAYQDLLARARQGTVEFAEALGGVTRTQIAVGRYADAARTAVEAAAAYEAVGDLASVAKMRNNRGRAAMYLADYAQAEEAFVSAIATSRELGHDELLSEHLSNLANVHYVVGRYADARRTYDEALALTGGASPGGWVDRRRRVIFANQAALHQRLGHDAEALALYRRVEEEGGELAPAEQAQVVMNLGVLYRRLGDPVKALQAYDRARTLFARERHVNGELGVMKNRGIVLALDLGRLDEAEQSFTDVLKEATGTRSQRDALHAFLYRGETRLRLGKLGEARSDFEAGLPLARELRLLEEEWKALYGLGRVETDRAASARYFEQAVAIIEQIREGIRLQALRSEFLNDKTEVYDALIMARSGAPPADVFALIERRHSRGWRDRLGLTAPVTLDAVQRALPPDALLLDYWSASDSGAVVVVSRAGAEVIPLAIAPGPIEQLVAVLAQGSSAEWRPLVADIGRAVLPPARWFDGIRRVLVVPDGVLSVLPFELLPVDGSLMVERAAVTYMPSAATLLREPPRRPRWAPPWRVQLDAFADPVFSSSPLDESDGVRARLTASADEVRLVDEELSGAGRLHVGADNKKRYLIERTGRAPVLHVATHAIIDAVAVEQSRIVFSPPDASSAAADYLFLREAYGLKLDGVELAVLSACDTARGKYARGEGVQSFSRAFLTAGARSTVTTLWRVADQSSAEFMSLFYHHLQRGEARDEALRLAKLRFLQSGSPIAHPHYWAAFTLAGDGLRPIPLAVRWATLGVWAAAVAAVAIGGASYARRRLRARRAAELAPGA